MADITVVVALQPNGAFSAALRSDRNKVMEILKELAHYKEIMMQFFGDYEYVIHPWQMSQDVWIQFVDYFVLPASCDVVKT